MANKKQQLPKDDAVNVADSVAETPEQQKTTLTQKTKQAFASFGGKVKGLFVKDKKQEMPEHKSEEQVVSYSADLLKGPELPRKEKFLRFLGAQSGWLFVLPAVVLMLIFTFYPIVNAFIGAFQQNYNALSGTYDGWGLSHSCVCLKAIRAQAVQHSCNVL